MGVSVVLFMVVYRWVWIGVVRKCFRGEKGSRKTYSEGDIRMRVMVSVWLGKDVLLSLRRSDLLMRLVVSGRVLFLLKSCKRQII